MPENWICSTICGGSLDFTEMYTVVYGMHGKVSSQYCVDWPLLWISVSGNWNFSAIFSEVFGV
jgi:hypothetical protein